MKPGNISVPLMSRVAEEGTGHVRERISSVPSVVLMCEAPTAAFFPGRAARLGFFSGRGRGRVPGRSYY